MDNALPLEKDAEERLSTSNNARPPSENALSENAPHEKAPSDKALSEGAASDEAPSDKVKGDQGAYDNKSKALIAILMVALCLAVFLAALDATIIATPLPTIAEHFHSSAGYTWIGSAFLLSSAASTPIWGKLSDIFGRKPILLIANFIFFIGSLVAGLSISIGMLITARAIQGVGAAGLLTMVDIVVCDLFSQRTRGLYLGVIGATWAIASSVGPVIGGAFTDKVSWRWCFYINLPLDALAFFIILFFLKLDTPKTPLVQGLLAIDWVGTLLVVGGTTTFLFGLQYGGQSHPWGSVIVICLLVFGILQVVLFVLWEWKGARYALMPPRLYRDISNVGCLLIAFFHGLAFIGVFYYLPLYFQAVLDASPLLSGVYTLPVALATGLSSMVTGGFVGGTGKYLPPLYLGAFLMTLGIGLFIDLPDHRQWSKLIIYQIICGLGIGPNFIAPLIGLQTRLDEGDIAVATATFNMLRNLATAIGVIAGQGVYQNEFNKRRGTLIATLGPNAAALQGGVEANIGVVKMLPPAQRRVLEAIFNACLHKTWIMYTCFAAAILLSAFLVKKRTLATEHQVTKTGLEAEEARAAKRRAAKNKVEGSGSEVA